MVPIPFEEILDMNTKKTRVRKVNINSIQYRIAREYMIRVEDDAFFKHADLGKMALDICFAPEKFVKGFEELIFRISR